jgi:hypothetical protein
VLSFLNLAMFIVAVVAGVMPFIWRWGAHARQRDISTMIVVPPLFLASSFLLAAAYRLVRYALLPDAHYVISRLRRIHRASDVRRAPGLRRPPVSKAPDGRG